MNPYQVRYKVIVRTVNDDEFEIENKLAVEAPFGAAAAEKAKDFLEKAYQYVSAVRSGEGYIPLLSPSQRTLTVEILSVESIES